MGLDEGNERDGTKNWRDEWDQMKEMKEMK